MGTVPSVYGVLAAHFCKMLTTSCMPCIAAMPMTVTNTSTSNQISYSMLCCLIATKDVRIHDLAARLGRLKESASPNQSSCLERVWQPVACVRHQHHLQARYANHSCLSPVFVKRRHALSEPHSVASGLDSPSGVSCQLLSVSVGQ